MENTSTEEKETGNKLFSLYAGAADLNLENISKYTYEGRNEQGFPIMKSPDKSHSISMIIVDWGDNNDNNDNNGNSATKTNWLSNTHSKRVLFLDDQNMFEGKNPIATLVDVFNVNEKTMKILERSQAGVGHRGGSWEEIMKDGDIVHNIISKGRKSDYTKDDYELEYKLTSGNY